MRSRAIAPGPADRSASISTRTTLTQPSMIIPAWRSASCTQTSAPTQSSRLSSMLFTFYRSHGITIRRILTDNAWSYTHNRALAELLAREDIQHKTIRPYRARTNGLVERFHQTMAREWGNGLSYASSRHRAQALPHWLEHYNERRPHSGIGNQPPISRVH